MVGNNKAAGRAEARGRAAEPIPLRELLSVADPTNAIERATRQAQLTALGRLIPMILVGQIIASTALTLSLTDNVPHPRLFTWWACVTAICLWRTIRAWRLRVDRAYVRRRPPSARTTIVISLMLGAIWWVPPLFFFGSADTAERIIMMVVTAGMVSAAGFTVATIPLAAFIQIWLLLGAATLMAVQFGEPWLVGLMPVYGALMSSAVITHARQFVRHVRARLQLQEQGELLELLQELQASGTGGLWELDANLTITKISNSLAEAIDIPVDDVIGLTAYQLMDPKGRIAEISIGMRTYFEHLENGVEFRDLAVPSSGRWWSLSAKPVVDGGEIVGWRGVASDVTALRLTGDDAVRAARTDPLTGVANRLLVRELLEEALLGQDDRSDGCALLLVDLDRFKLVNDTMGHAVGDQLLCEVARRLEGSVGKGGRIGRLGGDEFAVVWTGPSDDENLSLFSERLITELAKPFSVGAATMNIGATIGIARGCRDGCSEEQLMRSADLALYRAKEEGRGGYAFFDHSMYVAAEDLRSLENDVRDALDTAALRLVYQPIVDAHTSAVVGREALLRWLHPTRGEISPHRFIPIIEDAGLIHRIGDWVIRGACAEAAGWHEPLRIAVNVSAAQLTGPGLAQTVLGALAATGLAPDRLELEVTESVFLGDDAATLESLNRLRALGVRLVLDDFGKGYSSFGYLVRTCFSKIKIDQTFVRGAAQGSRESVAIVHAILALARGLGVETTAEGIETADQGRIMRELGCTQLQGFYFGRPTPAQADDRWPVGISRRRRA
jgi:diguanylate cyclase (GGDEF)-like protein